MTSIVSKRPRDVKTLQAASILYGDWGTSKAYVIGLAFALASYSSFWLIALLGVINILVGLNYIIICRCYPTGGGVYAAVHKRSEVLALMAAFFLIADYLVTASLSALSGFNYLGVAHPTAWSVFAIFGIGLLNYFGPRHTGNLAFAIALPTFIVVILLALVSIPFLGDAIANLEPLPNNLGLNWLHFTSVIVGMSGIEAIANTTGVMVLDDDKAKHPSVVKTSTPALLTILLEVTIFTTLFALAASAIPHLVSINGEVNAPGEPGVRDFLLRYMGHYFAGQLFGETVGVFFGIVISIVFCTLLLSAVNTAIVALVSLLFIMSRNQKVPRKFQKLNKFGVPLLPLVFATIVPMVLVFAVNDVAGLADLYAVGFVGAIATNLGSTSTDKSIKLSSWERVFMISTCLIMVAIEITLLIHKPHARNFATAIMAAGLFLRALVLERQEKKISKPALAALKLPMNIIDADHVAPEKEKGLLCAIKEPSKAFNYALNESIRTKKELFILYIHQQQELTEEDRTRTWMDDKFATELFNNISAKAPGVPIKFLYTISDSVPHAIAEMAEKLKVTTIIIDQRRDQRLYDFIRGSIIHQVGRILPPGIDLVVIV